MTTGTVAYRMTRLERLLREVVDGWRQSAAECQLASERIDALDDEGHDWLDGKAETYEECAEAIDAVLAAT